MIKDHWWFSLVMRSYRKKKLSKYVYIKKKKNRKYVFNFIKYSYEKFKHLNSNLVFNSLILILCWKCTFSHMKLNYCCNVHLKLKKMFSKLYLLREKLKTLLTRTTYLLSLMDKIIFRFLDILVTFLNIFSKTQFLWY